MKNIAVIYLCVQAIENAFVQVHFEGILTTLESNVRLVCV